LADSHCFLLATHGDSVTANIAEGFRQPTDRSFARYLSISASSAEESRAHLRAAEALHHLTRERNLGLLAEAREIANMLGGLVSYLRRCDRRDRRP
jgi:four helix bundle protein